MPMFPEFCIPTYSEMSVILRKLTVRPALSFCAVRVRWYFFFTCFASQSSVSAEITELCPIGDWQVVIEIGEKAQVYVEQFWLVRVGCCCFVLLCLVLKGWWWFCVLEDFGLRSVFLLFGTLSYITNTLQLLNYHTALHIAYMAKSYYFYFFLRFIMFKCKNMIRKKKTV